MSIFQNSPVPPSTSPSLKSHVRGTPTSSNGTIHSQSSNPQPVLEEGKIIKGEIIDISNKEVTIKLDNNQTITAPLKGGAELSIGQTVSFEVVADGQNGIALKPLTKTLPPALESTVNKALEAAGLPKTIKNLELVRELLANQMSIDKQSLQKLLRQSLLHKDAQISTLVLMAKHNIPMTEANITQFENYRNYQHQIAKQIDGISNSLPEIFEQLSKTASPKELTGFHNELLTALLTDTPALSINREDFPVYLTSSGRTELLSLLNEYPIPPELKEQLLQGNGSLKEVLSLINTDLSLAIQADEENLAKTMMEEEVDVSKLVLTQDKFKSPLVANILEQYNDMLKEQGKIAPYLNTSDREQLLASLKDTPLPDNIIKMIQSGEITTKDLLSIIHSYLPLLDETASKGLLSSSSYKSLVKEQLLTNWTLTPKALGENNGLPDLYERMEKQLSEIEQLTLRNDQSPTLKSSADIQGLRQNLDFMKTLNEFFTYVQIPVRLKDKTLHSDLYVYTNKKELKKNKNNISILLHLDMDFLGSMDIHVELNHNQVNSRFYLETEEGADVIKKNMEQLEEALNNKGFLFQYEVLKREKEKDLITDFLKKDSPGTSLKRYSFDIRA